MRFMVFLFFGLAVLLPAVVVAGIADDLSPAQIKQLDRGRDVVVEEPVEGNPWPRARIYRVVEAAPEEVTAVFFDYNEACTYMPGVLESAICRKVSPAVMEVDYKVGVPILPDESYTVRNSLHPVSNGLYQIDWKLLKATTTQASVGSFRVEAFGEGSIICYENFVTPGSKMAGLLRGMALERLRQTVSALADQVKSQRDNHPDVLNRQVRSLKDALPLEVVVAE